MSEKPWENLEKGLLLVIGWRGDRAWRHYPLREDKNVTNKLIRGEVVLDIRNDFSQKNLHQYFHHNDTKKMAYWKNELFSLNRSDRKFVVSTFLRGCFIIPATSAIPIFRVGAIKVVKELVLGFYFCLICRMETVMNRFVVNEKFQIECCLWLFESIIVTNKTAFENVFLGCAPSLEPLTYAKYWRHLKATWNFAL